MSEHKCDQCGKDLKQIGEFLGCPMIERCPCKGELGTLKDVRFLPPDLLAAPSLE